MSSSRDALQSRGAEFQPAGLATGIGSLPHRRADQALDAVLRWLPEAPFWPQLPRRSPWEGMTLQYLEGFPGLRTRGEGADPIVDTGEGGLGELESFYAHVLSDDLEPFKLSRTRAPGFYALEERLVQSPPRQLRFVKGHVTGPVTLASSLKDGEGREITYDEGFREAVASLVAQKARWQVRRLGRFGVPVILFLDEPVMEVFGSAYSGLSREMVLGMWKPAVDALAGEEVVLGVHCCGNTDWGLLFEAGVNVVNFDAYHYLEKMLLYPVEVARYLASGGVLAWGVVPTTKEAEAESTAALLRRLDEGIGAFAERGVDEALLRRQCIITPSCGMGSLDEGLAERILELTAGVAAGFEV